MNKLNFKLLLAFAVSTMILLFIVIKKIFSLPTYFLLLAYLIMFLLILFLIKRDIYLIIGNLALVKGKTEKASNYFKKSIDLDIHNPLAYLNYGVIKTREGDWEIALEYLEKAESLNPNIITDKNIQLAKGSCYWIKGDIDKAIDVLEKLRQKYEYVNSHVLTTLAYMYISKENYDISLDLTNKALEDDPNSAAAWDNLGQIYFNTNEFEKSKESFEKALELKNDLVDSLYYLGELYEAENELDKAKELFIKAKSAPISALNTVSIDKVNKKYNKYTSK